jgi:hypothetical protein
MISFGQLLSFDGFAKSVRLRSATVRVESDDGRKPAGDLLGPVGEKQMRIAAGADPALMDMTSKTPADISWSRLMDQKSKRCR